MSLFDKDDWSDGRTANALHVARDQNPHPAGTKAHRMWNLGWDHEKQMRAYREPDKAGQTTAKG